MDRQMVFDYIKKKYRVSPESPWRRYAGNAVFRHSDNNKWFALVMDVQADKLGLSGNNYVDVINLKVDDLFFRDMIIQENGIMPAYHMNKIDVLKAEYGIYAVRGPKGIPNSLSEALKK